MNSFNLQSNMLAIRNLSYFMWVGLFVLVGIFVFLVVKRKKKEKPIKGVIIIGIIALFFYVYVMSYLLMKNVEPFYHLPDYVE